MPFEIGNDLGRKARLVSDAIRRSIIQDDGVRLRNGVERLMDSFNEGEPWALAMVMDRLEGKPAQAVTVSGDDERPLVSVIKTLIVYPDNSNGINSLRTVEGETVKENSLLESQEQAAPPTLPHAVILGEGGGGEVGTIPSATNSTFEVSTQNQDR